MDITPTSTNNTTSTTKSPEPDTETPTTKIHNPTKSLPFTNGFLKRHQPHNYSTVTYKECLKNHAASLGGHALDGCGEFMPSPAADPANPTSLKCAACGCHRNFHRQEPDEPILTSATTKTTHVLEYQPHHRHQPPPPGPHRSNSVSPPPISSYYPSGPPHMLLALSGGMSGQPEGENIAGSVRSSSGRKRFRTKFTQSQKERMLEFAERVGWKMQRKDEEMVQEFCNEIGVERGVLKVWMHNNKSTYGKKDVNVNGNGNGNGNADTLNLGDNHNGVVSINGGENVNHYHNDSVVHEGTNGSSSSS